MNSLKLISRVNQGRISTKVSQEVADFIKQFEGKELVLTIEKRKSKRSIQQNKYYWGICVPIIQEGLKDLGYRLDKEETHYFLKSRFHYNEMICEATGEVIKVPKSTTEMGKSDFIEYIEQIKQFGAEILNVYVPEPSEQLSLV